MVDTVGSGMPFVATGNGGNDGGFGGGGAIWAIVLIALLGFNRGGRGDGDCAQDAVNNAELNDRIDNVNALAEQRANLKETCETNMNVSKTGAGLEREILESKYDTAIQLKDLQAAQASCCCETQRSIDRSMFENAKGQWDISRQIADCCCSTNLAAERNTNAIIANQTAGTQRIVDLMTADKIESLRDQLSNERLKASQCAQNEYLVRALGPQTPVPAYVTYPNCSPVFPPAVAASSNAVYGAFGLNGGNNGCACGF